MRTSILTILAAGLVGMVLSAAHILSPASLLPPTLCAAAMVLALVSVLGRDEHKL